MPDVIERRECPECGGPGSLVAWLPDGHGGKVPEERDCSVCDGSGFVVWGRLDALLRDDVVEAGGLLDEIAADAADDDALVDRDAHEDAATLTRAALAAAVKHLTGGGE